MNLELFQFPLRAITQTALRWCETPGEPKRSSEPAREDARPTRFDRGFPLANENTETRPNINNMKSKNIKNQESKLITELHCAYAMELETVQNYIANAVNLDGLRADTVKKALAADVTSELSHAQLLAQRIKTIGGRVPGSFDNDRTQTFLQPPKRTTDVLAVVKGVIRAEEEAIAQYKRIIALCDGVDFVTQDLAVEILASEEEHRREFLGFLRECEE